MLFDLTDYDSKKLELDIKDLEIAILERKGFIANLEYKKLNHELKLMEQGITEEDIEKYIKDFMESSDNPEKELLLIYDEYEEMLEEDEDLIIEDLDKIIKYSMISFSIIHLQIQDYQEELKVLREQKLKLMDKQLKLQKKKVDEIATERKYKELLKDEN
ncbi:MAG: hypothetical protein J6Y42_00840 [Bacilli bacterium]|nr:hypothetical protein [Bacilli bacterium]